MRKNLPLKILATICAILLWIFVINEGFRIDYLDTEIPIQPKNLSEDLLVVNDLGSVKLKLRAPQDIWQQKNIAKQIEACVDLKYYDRGEYNLDIKVFTKNPSIQIIEQEPQMVDVILAPAASIEKDVKLETKGTLGKGYQAGEPEFSKSNVKVEGPQQILDQVNKVVAPIEFNNEMSEIKTKIKLEAHDSNNNKIKKVKIIPEEIEVTIPIEKEENEKTVGVKANIINSPPGNSSIQKIEVDPSTVTIKGKSEDLENINNIETNSIDASTLTDDKNILTIDLNLPADIDIEGDNIVEVTIYLSQETIAKSFQGIIRYKNLASNLKVAGIMPSRINLTIEGPSAKLDKLSEKNVYIEFDLSSKNKGTHEFIVRPESIISPEGIAVKSIETGSVKIIIEAK